MNLCTWTFVALGALAQTATPAGDTSAAKKYTIDVSKTTSDVKAGAGGTFALHIQAAAGFKVSHEAPLKITLQSDGLKLAKSALGAADAKDKKATSPEFEVKFGADAAGQKKIEVDATFFVCDDKICERKKETLSVPVSVRP
jgi:hypothetical protein